MCGSRGNTHASFFQEKEAAKANFKAEIVAKQTNHLLKEKVKTIQKAKHEKDEVTAAVDSAMAMAAGIPSSVKATSKKGEEMGKCVII